MNPRRYTKAHEGANGQLSSRLTSPASRWTEILLCAAVLGYILFFAALALTQHRALQSGLDMAFYDQTLWNTAQGHLFALSLQPGKTNKLADHIQPTIALFVPLYWLLPRSTELFLVAIVIALAAGAFPVYGLARAQLQNKFIALVFALVYLLYPAVQSASIPDFHSVNLAIPLFLFALYALQRGESRRHVVAFFILIILAMGCREEIALSVVMVGIYIAVALKKPRLGGITTILGGAWFALVTLVILPALNPDGVPHTYLYRDLGQDFGEIVLTILTRPIFVARLIFTAPKTAYMRDLLTPVAFLPLFNPLAALTGAAALLINLLSSQEVMYTAERHYSSPVVPFVLFSSIHGARVLLRWAQRTQLTRLIPATVMACSLWYGYYHGFSPLYANFQYPAVTAHHRLLPQLLERIPSTAGVTAQFYLVPHLTHRQHVYAFPLIRPETDYIILDVTSNPLTMAGRKVYYRAVQEILNGAEFELVTAQDGYILLKRRGAVTASDRGAELNEEFYDFARVADAQPQFPVKVDYGQVGAQRYGQVVGAQRAAPLLLTGIDFIPHRDCQVSVRTYWQALASKRNDYDFDFWLHDVEGTVHWKVGARLPQLWYPSSIWRTGETVVVESPRFALSRLGEGFFSVHVPLSSDDAQILRPRVRESELFMPTREYGSNLVLPAFRCDRTIAKIIPTWRRYTTPDIAHPLTVNLADQIILHGYDVVGGEARLAPTVRAGAEARFTLYWQATTAPLAYYNVFVHLLDATGTRIAQYDAPPLDGAYPTSWWARGEVVADPRRVAIPAGTPPGEYAIWVGMYDLETMARLRVVGDSAYAHDNAVKLLTVQVVE